MVYFLRTPKNKTVVDINCYIKDGYVDLNVSINIKNYSILLLNDKQNKQIEMLLDFHNINELRGWLWEIFKNNTENNFNIISAEIQKILKNIGNKYNLQVVTD